MALASPIKVILGSVAFAIFWVLAVFPAVPFLPIGRTAGSLLGAALMVVFQVLTPNEAYAAIDLPILGLLFGTMLVSAFLEQADMFKYLGKLMSWKSRGGKDLLFRVCLVSAFSSALFTNDTACVALTEFVLKIARQNNLPALPFLLALASSSNIGSSATPIGNPQNLVIAVQGRISFGTFLKGLVGPMLVGLLVNAGILLCCFWKTLSVKKKDVETTSTVIDDVEVDDEMNSHRFSPATMSHQSSFNSQDLDVTLASVGVAGIGERSIRSRRCSSKTEIELIAPDMKEAGTPGIAGTGESVVLDNGMESGRLMRQREVVNDVYSATDAKEVTVQGWKRTGQKVSVYAVTLGMLVAFLMGLDLSWTAITAALALMVIDFKDAQPCLQKVSYSLLIFFCGMFITVDGLNSTGIPNALWDLVEPYSQVDTAHGVALLSLMVLVLSNIASNVPTVLLLGARVAASATKSSQSEVTKAWLILAFVSTVAGNLSLLGSAANLIVCEQARRAPVSKYNLSFFSHLCFGIPSTIVVIIVGVLLLSVS